MGFNRSYIKDEDGNIVAVRDTKDDGSSSYTYEYDGGIVNEILSVINPHAECGELLSHDLHDKDGTTRPA
jgi:hypothetical protein